MRAARITAAGGEGVILAALVLFGTVLFVLPLALVFAQGWRRAGNPR